MVFDRRGKTPEKFEPIAMEDLPRWDLPKENGPLKKAIARLAGRYSYCREKGYRLDGRIVSIQELIKKSEEVVTM